jgi:hypothetical protein
MRNYRKRKAHVKLRKTKRHKHLGQLTPHQFQLYIITIKPMNTFKRIFSLACRFLRGLLVFFVLGQPPRIPDLFDVSY